MTLREQRCTFSVLLCHIGIWIVEQGWQFCFGELYIRNPRRMRGVNAGTYLKLEDGEHIRKSFHYMGLAVDVNLYDDLDEDGQDDDYIDNGDDPRWKAIAKKWESMHPLCTSGRRFEDANHLSFGEVDKSKPLP